MPTRLQPLNLRDFTGGLNLRADAFQLQDNESPEMCNVDVDPRGGVTTRKSWHRMNPTNVAGTWNPRSLHVWEQSDGNRKVLLGNNGGVFVSSGGNFTQLSDATAAIATNADVHSVDFNEWGPTMYMVCGPSNQCRKWTGTGNAARLTANDPLWQNDYTLPVGGFMPKADLVEAYQAFQFVANTNENGTQHPNRIRWSHPNNPENWAQLDYIDIDQGGAKITALQGLADQLVIFKTNSVWALHGYDAESFALTNITHKMGAIHRNAVAKSDQTIYFYSHPNGLQEYRPGEGVYELSPQLRPIIDTGLLNPQALDNMFVGFQNRRVWWGAPYDLPQNPLATDVRKVFVFDPTIQAWVQYCDPDDVGLGPFATGNQVGEGALLLAAHRSKPVVVHVESNDHPGSDQTGAAPEGFHTYYTTRWLHADWPSLRKSWRRPDYIVAERDLPYRLTVNVYRDYDESEVRSQHFVDVETGGGGALWGQFDWGEANWGGAIARGSHIERGGSVGLARAVQLNFNGTPGKPWGMEAIVMKYRARRFR